MLGALAIISAVLIVLADRDKRNSTPIQHTETETVTPGAPSGPPAAPSGWTSDQAPTRVTIGLVRFEATVAADQAAP